MHKLLCQWLLQLPHSRTQWASPILPLPWLHVNPIHFRGLLIPPILPFPVNHFGPKALLVSWRKMAEWIHGWKLKALGYLPCMYSNRSAISGMENYSSTGSNIASSVDDYHHLTHICQILSLSGLRKLTRHLFHTFLKFNLFKYFN